MARPVELNGHDRRRPPAHYWTAPSHQLWRTQGERQRSHSYEHAGQTFKTVGLAHTMPGALDMVLIATPLSRLACMFVAEGVVFVPVVRYN